MNARRGRIVLWSATLAVVVLLVWQARIALIPFAFGALLAYTLTPIVDAVAALVPISLFERIGRSAHQADVYRRAVAVLLVYAVIGAALFLFGTWMIPALVSQVAEFVDELPRYFDQARSESSRWLSQFRRQLPPEMQAEIDQYTADATTVVSDAVAGMVRRLITLLTGTIGIVFGFLIVPFWMFYALRDRHNVTRSFMNAVPAPMRDDVERVLAIADQLLFRYVRAQLLLGLIVGTAVGAGLTVMGIPLALALGLIAGITELIPILGPWIGGIAGILIVAATRPDMILWALLLYVVVQQVENALLVPRIQGHAVELHPGMVILLLIAAGATFGFVGVVVVVPLTAILRELFWYADRRLNGVPPAEAYSRSRVVRELAPAHTRLFARLTRRLRRPAPTPEEHEEPGAAPRAAEVVDGPG